MTVEVDTSEFTYIGDGVSTTFPFPSRFLAESDIVVGIDGVLAGGYTVIGAGAEAGGSVVFSAAPAAGARVALLRAPAASQLLDFVNGQTVLEGVLDNGLDKLTMLIQYLLRQTKRAVRLPEFDAYTPVELPSAATRAQRVLGFDAAGALTTVPALTFVPTAAAAGHAASRSAAEVTSYAVGVSAIYVAGRLSAGDGGGGTYTRAEAAPVSGGFRSLDRYTAAGAEDAVNGGWWKPVGVVTVGMYGSASAAAQAAYDNACALHIAAGAATVSVAFGNDGRANYATLVAYLDWLSKCQVGPRASVRLRPDMSGLKPLTVYDVKGDGRPAIEWAGYAAGILNIAHDASIFLTIVSVTFGAAGAAHHPVYRTNTQYPVTIGLASALPSYVDIGYPVWAQCVQGDVADALLASGPLMVEWIAADRLSFRATIQTSKATVTSPTSISGVGTYQTLSTNVLRVPPAAFLWDTEYTISPGTSVAGISAGAITTITSAAHGLANGDLVRFSGSAPSQLLGRTFYVQGVTTNTFTLRTCNNDDVDSSAYDAYVSGANLYKVSEVWTGASQEALFNVRMGALMLSNIGFSWGGWLHGNTGVTADQDLVFASLGGTVIVEEGAVLVGAGDKVLRSYGDAQFYGNRAAIGGGGSQSAGYTQGGGKAEFIRSGIGHTVTNSVFGSDGSSHIYNGTTLVGSGNTVVRMDDMASASIYPVKIYGGTRGVYTSGGRVVVAGSTEIDGNGTGMDAIGGGTIVGLPTFGANTVNCANIQDGVGGTSSGKGGGRWISGSTANQTPPVLLSGQSWRVAGTIAATGAGRMTLAQTNETVAVGGASRTQNTPLGQITISAPTIAAGSFGDITINNSLVTATSQVSAYAVGGTHTAGVPVVTVRSRAAGSFVLRVNNTASAAFSGGTLIVGYKVEN